MGGVHRLFLGSGFLLSPQEGLLGSARENNVFRGPQPVRKSKEVCRSVEDLSAEVLNEDTLKDGWQGRGSRELTPKTQRENHVVNPGVGFGGFALVETQEACRICGGARFSERSGYVAVELFAGRTPVFSPFFVKKDARRSPLRKLTTRRFPQIPIVGTGCRGAAPALP